MKNRDTAIDQIKGILIILVVLGHALQYGYGLEYLESKQYYYHPLFQGIYSFHMPLFSLISGYFFYSSAKKPLGKVFMRKARQLLVPTISFCSLLFVIDIVSKVLKSHTAPSIGDLLTRYYFYINLNGWSMWFLKSMFLCSVIIILLLICTGRNEKLCACLLTILVGSSFFCPDSYVLSAHKFMLPFFALGYYLNRAGVSLTQPLYGSVEILSMSVLSICLLYFYDRHSFIYSGFGGGKIVLNVYRIVTGLIVSRVVCLAITLFIERLPVVIKENLALLGKETLGIYGFQSIAYVILMKSYSLSSISFSSRNLIVAIAIAFVVLLLSHCFFWAAEHSKTLSKLLLGR